MLASMSFSSSGLFHLHRARGAIWKTVDEDFSKHHGLRPKDRQAKIRKCVVKGLYYCQSELRCQGAAIDDYLGLPSLRGGLNHDFLIVEFCLKGVNESFFLRAEKTASLAGSLEGSGIRIDILPPSISNFKRNILFEIFCSVEIDLGEGISAFEDHDPDYQLADKNCWAYTVEAGQDVLNTLANATV